jgi:chromosome segregation ATPase
MSLLEKYSSIHRGIDQARDETASMRLKIEETQQQIERLKEERASMKDQTKIHGTERKTLESQTEQALVELMELEQTHSIVLAEHGQAKSKLDNVKRLAQEHRQAFLEDTRAFRSSCKRLCVRAGLLGLTHAPLGAYRIVQQTRGKDAHLLQEDDDESSSSTNLNTGCGRGQDYDKKNDEEMTQALLCYQNYQKSHRLAEQARDDTAAKKNGIVEKAENRKNRKAQLQAQLERIQKDVGQLESQIAMVGEQTAEAKDMGNNFENGE